MVFDVAWPVPASASKFWYLQRWYLQQVQRRIIKTVLRLERIHYLRNAKYLVK